MTTVIKTMCSDDMTCCNQVHGIATPAISSRNQGSTVIIMKNRKPMCCFINVFEFLCIDFRYLKTVTWLDNIDTRDQVL